MNSNILGLTNISEEWYIKNILNFIQEAKVGLPNKLTNIIKGTYFLWEEKEKRNRGFFLSIFLSICLSVCLSIYLSIFISFFFLSSYFFLLYFQDESDARFLNISVRQLLTKIIILIIKWIIIKQSWLNNLYSS